MEKWFFMGLAIAGGILAVYVMIRNGVYQKEIKAIKKMFTGEELEEEIEKAKLKIFLNKSDEQIIKEMKEWKEERAINKKLEGKK